MYAFFRAKRSVEDNVFNRPPKRRTMEHIWYNMRSMLDNVAQW